MQIVQKCVYGLAAFSPFVFSVCKTNKLLNSVAEEFLKLILLFLLERWHFRYKPIVLLAQMNMFKSLRFLQYSSNFEQTWYNTHWANDLRSRDHIPWGGGRSGPFKKGLIW